MTTTSRLTFHLQGLLRIVVALLVLQHGTTKFFGFPGLAFPGPLVSLISVAGVLEIVGGVLMLVGFHTRPVSIVLSGEMAFSYFITHAPKSFFFPQINGGEAAVLYCFIFLFFSAAGSGSWSLDRKFRSG